MPFSFRNLEIEGVVLIEPRVFRDERGFFLETYKLPDFVEAGIAKPFVQDNFVRSFKGALRGIHYQKAPYAQGKLVSVMQGEIYDVAVDIRKGSPTYGRWLGVTLSGEKRNMLYIPEGFAHGYLTLSDTADIFYKVTSVYTPEAEAGIIWNDTDLKINWPVKEPLLLDRDKRWPSLKETGAVS